MLAMDFVGRVPPKERRARALELLERVGVRDQADKLPATLSGGQRQRVAVARALANDPSVVVADEPTGNLDRDTAERVMSLFGELAAAGTTVVVVTHEHDPMLEASRTLSLDDGRLEG